MENDLQLIKSRLLDEELIPMLLEELGLLNIKEKENRYEAQLPDSKNSRSVQVYKNEYLSCKIRNRGISTDIYGLIGYVEYGVEEFEDVKPLINQLKTYVCLCFDWQEYLTYSSKEIKKKNDYLFFLRDVQKSRKKREYMSSKIEKGNNVIDKKSTFMRYYKLPHVTFIDDGISARTQNEFEVMFCSESQRVVFPIYNEDGELISVKGRYVGDNQKTMSEVKYIYQYKFDKSIELYNLHKAKKHIEEKNFVIVFESEKSCMKAWQMGYRNTVAICGSEVSPIQKQKLITLGVEVIFAFDKDMDLEHIKNQSKHMRTRKVYAIYDNDNLLSGKESPVDRGKDVFETLLGGLYEIN